MVIVGVDVGLGFVVLPVLGVLPVGVVSVGIEIGELGTPVDLVGLVVGLSVGLFVGLFIGLSVELFVGLSVGLLFGLSVG